MGITFCCPGYRFRLKPFYTTLFTGGIVFIKFLLIAAIALPISSFARLPDHPNDLDLTKFSCSRLEQQNGQRFLSEIHFAKAGHINIPKPTNTPDLGSASGIANKSAIEGEVLSYLIRNDEKIYISGYSLFSISYHDQIISGMTGDPYSRADGSFSLVPLSNGLNGFWRFSYTGLNNQQITAEFKCIYNTRNVEN